MDVKGLTIPEGYTSPLSIQETERAIKLCKDTFEKDLAERLQLERVSAPLFVNRASGLNDNLNGVERPVGFDIPDVGGAFEIVQSLAKWKRLALYRYGFPAGYGLYTDMNAIRRDETLDNIHSVYVDQWDWEKVLTKATRNKNTLEETVQLIILALYHTQKIVCDAFPSVSPLLKNDNVYYVTTQELEDRYPMLMPRQREDEICREHGTVFIEQIGGALKSGEKHDGRAPDYDDWTLNGDILVWYPVLNRGLELSSMGIRVDAAALDQQLRIAGCDDRRSLPFHKMLLSDELPLTMGGGIGQSRICLAVLGKAHLGEVQASVWPADVVAECERRGVSLL